MGATLEEDSAAREAIVSASFNRVRADKFNCISSLFSNCANLSSVDLGGLSVGGEQVMGADGNTYLANSMDSMFFRCSSLEEVDLVDVDPSHYVCRTGSMFAYCTSLRAVDLRGSGLVPESHGHMFYKCEAIESFSYDETWPLDADSIPEPTADNGKWFSTADGAWMTVDEIVARGARGDTLLNYDPNPEPARTDLSTATVSVAGWTYDGASHDVLPTVTLGDTTLAAGDDYELSGDTSARDAGPYAVTVTGRGSYEGIATGTYEVARRHVTVRADDKSKTEGDGDPTHTATVTGTLGSDTVSYSLSRSSGEAPGRYAITPEGVATQGNYEVKFVPGTLTVRARAAARTDLSGATVSVEGWTYDVASHDVAPTVTLGGATLAAGADYELSGDTSARDAGPYEVTVTGTGSYEGSATATYEVARASITSVEVADQAWTGTALRPVPTVRAGSVTVPPSGYEATYSDNVDPGTATVEVTGKGNFQGTRSAKFRIARADERPSVLDELRDDVRVARSANEEAAAAYDAAVAAAGDADVGAAQSRRDAAQRAHASAQGTEAATRSAAESARQRDAAAKAEQAAAGANRASASAAKSSADEDLAAAQGELDEANEDARRIADSEALADAVEQKDRELEAAKAATAKAESDRQVAERNKQAADEAAAEAKTAMEDAKAAWDAAVASGTSPDDELAGVDWTQGSLGFFQWLDKKGLTKTDFNVTALTGLPFHYTNPRTGRTTEYENDYAKHLTHTELGGEGDATSLENMGQAIRWVRVANMYRQRYNDTYGLTPENDAVVINENYTAHYCVPLLVADTLMVDAQLAANYSATTTTGQHSERNCDGANNAICIKNTEVEPYNDVRNPFYGWYDMEQAAYLRGKGLPYDEAAATAYDNNNCHEVGHFFTLVDPDFTMTGFAVCNNVPKWTVRHEFYDQTFGDPRFMTIYNPTTWTVDEFEALFEQYTALVDAKGGTSGKTPEQIAYERAYEAYTAKAYAAGTAANALTRANSSLREAQQAEAQAQTSYDAAVAALESSGLTAEQVLAIRNRQSAAQTAYDQARQAVDDAAAALEAADRRLAAADSEASSAATALASAEEAYSQAQAATRSAKDALDAAEGDLTAAREAAAVIAAAQAELDGADHVLAEAVRALDDATDVSKAEVIGVTGRTYTGAAQTQAGVSLRVTVRRGSRSETYELRPGVGGELGLDVTYANNVNAGTAQVTLSAKGQRGSGTFWGTKVQGFSIAAASLAGAKVAVPGQTYTGRALTPAPTVTVGGRTLLLGTDYSVSYTSNINTGIASVTVTGKGNYMGTASGQFGISRASVAGATVSGLTDQTWTGSAFTPKPKVTLGGRTLAEGTDYALSYKDNVSPGTATVTVTGRGNYTGTKSATFRIVAKTFPDVPSGAWYAGVVSRAAGLGLINGYANGNFGPNDRITRGQVAVMLWNMAGGPQACAGARDFPDVRSTDYYYRAVRWASSVGVVSGYANGRFGPSDDVTREQLTVMLANYARNVAHRQASGSAADFASMSDAARVSSWAAPAVGWCFKNKILSGSRGRVLPQGNATRAEAAKMVVYLHDLLV